MLNNNRQALVSTPRSFLNGDRKTPQDYQLKDPSKDLRFVTRQYIRKEIDEMVPFDYVDSVESYKNEMSFVHPVQLNPAVYLGDGKTKSLITCLEQQVAVLKSHKILLETFKFGAGFKIEDYCELERQLFAQGVDIRKIVDEAITDMFAKTIQASYLDVLMRTSLQNYAKENPLELSSLPRYSNAKSVEPTKIITDINFHRSQVEAFFNLFHSSDARVGNWSKLLQIIHSADYKKDGVRYNPDSGVKQLIVPTALVQKLNSSNLDPTMIDALLPTGQYVTPNGTPYQRNIKSVVLIDDATSYRLKRTFMDRFIYPLSLPEDFNVFSDSTPYKSTMCDKLIYCSKIRDYKLVTLLDAVNNLLAVDYTSVNTAIDNLKDKKKAELEKIGTLDDLTKALESDNRLNGRDILNLVDEGSVDKGNIEQLKKKIAGVELVGVIPKDVVPEPYLTRLVDIAYRSWVSRLPSKEKTSDKIVVEANIAGLFELEKVVTAKDKIRDWYANTDNYTKENLIKLITYDLPLPVHISVARNVVNDYFGMIGSNPDKVSGILDKEFYMQEKTKVKCSVFEYFARFDMGLGISDPASIRYFERACIADNISGLTADFVEAAKFDPKVINLTDKYAPSLYVVAVPLSQKGFPHTHLVTSDAWMGDKTITNAEVLSSLNVFEENRSGLTSIENEFYGYQNYVHSQPRFLRGYGKDSAGKSDGTVPKSTDPNKTWEDDIQEYITASKFDNSLEPKYDLNLHVSITPDLFRGYTQSRDVQGKFDSDRKCHSSDHFYGDLHYANKIVGSY